MTQLNFLLAKDVLGMKSNAVYDSTRDGYVLNGAKVRIPLIASLNIAYLLVLRYLSYVYLYCDGRCGLPMGH